MTSTTLFGMELPVVVWMFILSQIFGLVNIIIAVIKYQFKDKAKTLRLSAVGNIFRSLNYAFLLNWSLAGLKVVSIFKNLFFAKTSKGDVSRAASITGFIIFTAVSASVVFVSWWFTRLWFEWVILAAVVFANYGKWAKGVHILRVSKMAYYSVLLVNSFVFFLNPTSIIKAIAVMTSIIIFYIRILRKPKQTAEPEATETTAITQI